MEPSTSHNLNLLWNRLDSQFKTDHYEPDQAGKLQAISIFKKISLSSSTSEKIKAKFNQALSEILKNVILRLKQEEKIYLTNQGSGLFASAEALYSPKYPVYYLAEKIKKHPELAKQDQIIELANEILGFQTIYPDSKVTDGVQKGMDDPKILHWDETPP